VYDLPLQVAEIDYIEIEYAHVPDARGREIKGERRAQPSRADAQYPCIDKLFLSFQAYFRHDEVS
jgi:hypothetical protein